MHLDRTLSLGPLAFQGENASVSRVVTASGETLILKAGAAAREGEIVIALAAHQPFVPEFFGETAQGLFFSELPGRNLAEAFEQSSKHHARLAYALGEALHRIHTWEPPIEKPVTQWRDEALARVKATALAHSGEPIKYDYSPFVGQDHAALAAWVDVESAKTPHQLAFCHGDACLPNFMTDGGTITGVVDWGDGGWADPRFDLATTLWSLRRNGADDCQEHFLQGYGWEGGVASLALFEAFYTLWE